MPEGSDPWRIERAAWNEGKVYVAGVDEAGRGPLAGPVVAAAVILPESFAAAGVGDSKKLSAAARERAFARICDEALAFCIAEATPAEIDALNILRATHLAMRRAVSGLALPPDVVFVDGLPVKGLHADCRNVIKGDSLCLSIGAASILAKVTRDRAMIEADALYPGYGFAGHKGYPSPAHLEALKRLGPCPLHRRSFGPVAQLALF